MHGTEMQKIRWWRILQNAGNRCFKRREEHRVTCESGGRCSPVDYISGRRWNLTETEDKVKARWWTLFKELLSYLGDLSHSDGWRVLLVPGHRSLYGRCVGAIQESIRVFPPLLQCQTQALLHGIIKLLPPTSATCLEQAKLPPVFIRAVKTKLNINYDK